MKISIIGLGWYGLPLAQSLNGRHEISGTKSSREAIDNWNHPDIKAFELNLDNEISIEKLSLVFNVDCIVLNIPPSRKAENAVDAYLKRMEKLSRAFSKFPIAHLIFISSTGVFGDAQKNVDENTTPLPDRDAGKALLAAEQIFTETFNGRYSIIRPGGLVGGERHPYKFLAGNTGIKGKLHPVNLVHRDDLIKLTEAIIEEPGTQKVFHAVARNHPDKKTYYTGICAKLSKPLPRFDESDTSQGKIISAEITKAKSGVSFEFEDPFDMV